MGLVGFELTTLGLLDHDLSKRVLGLKQRTLKNVSTLGYIHFEVTRENTGQFAFCKLIMLKNVLK